MTRVTFTRREMLGAGLGLAGAALAVGSIGFGALNRPGRASHLAEATYRPLVGDVFTASKDTGTIDLTLAGTRSLGPLRYGPGLLAGKEHFALDFNGPAGMRSGLQTLSHPALGQFQLFVSPVGQPASIQRYEAIVNTYGINIGRRIDG